MSTDPNIPGQNSPAGHPSQDHSSPPESPTVPTPGSISRPLGEKTTRSTAEPQMTEEQKEESIRRASRQSSPDIEVSTVQPRPADSAPTDEWLRLMQSAPRIPDHVPVRKLGEGTYGEVWLYQEDHSRRRVAIKFLHRRTREQWLLLQAEVKQLAMLDGDPGIVQLRDVEPDARPPYYVMTYAEGGSLSDRIAKGPIPVKQALELFRRITAALAYVHAKGVRHCDLKPGNILLDARGRPLIGDFGQAHLEDDLSPALGTFFFMAPEQADLKQSIADTRWDVYGLGALFYTMLVGEPPRNSTAIRDELAGTVELTHRLQRYRDHVAVTPLIKHRRVKGVDRHLAHIIDRCLEVDPDKRHRDAGAVLAALDQRKRALRRQPLLLFGLLAPVVLMMVTALFSRWALQQALEQAEEALVARLQESDRTSARLVANVIEDALVDRKKYIESCAAQEEFTRAILAQKGPDELEQHLRGFQARRARKWFDGWFLADRAGRMLAHHPENSGVARNFRWRDWFHGQGDRLGESAHPFKPIRATHISQPYVGKVITRKLAVAISTPVWIPGQEGTGEPIAVLAARFPVEELHDWLSDVKIDNGFALLLNERCHCLLHQSMDRIVPEDGAAPPSYRECGLFRALIEDRHVGSSAYVDPVDQQEYLVSYAPFSGRLDKSIRWGALIQHQRQAALKPIEDLRVKLRWVGLMSLATSVLLTFGLWSWLVLTLRRSEA